MIGCYIDPINMFCLMLMEAVKRPIKCYLLIIDDDAYWLAEQILISPDFILISFVTSYSLKYIELNFLLKSSNQ